MISSSPGPSSPDRVDKDDIKKAFQTQQQTFEAKEKCVSIVDILVQTGILDREAAREVVRQVRKQPPPPEKDGSGAAPSAAAALSESKSVLKEAGDCSVVIRTVSFQTGRKFTRLDMTGTIDADTFAEVQEIIDEVTEQAGDEGRYLILNLENVDYMNSSGVGIVISANRAAKDRGGVLALTNVPDDVRGVMEVIGLGSVFTFYTMVEALDVIAGA